MNFCYGRIFCQRECERTRRAAAAEAARKSLSPEFAAVEEEEKRSSPQVSPSLFNASSPNYFSPLAELEEETPLIEEEIMEPATANAPPDPIQTPRRRFLRVATWNAQGAAEKRLEIMANPQVRQIDILAVCETMTKMDRLFNLEGFS